MVLTGFIFQEKKKGNTDHDLYFFYPENVQIHKYYIKTIQVQRSVLMICGAGLQTQTVDFDITKIWKHQQTPAGKYV